MDFGIYAGDTDKTIYVRLRDSTTGLAKTGLVFNSAGAVCSYTLPAAARAAITLATQTVTGAHSDGGFVEVDGTNCKGLYRLDLPDAAIASGSFTIISIEFDGTIEESVLIPLHIRKVNTTQIGGTTQTARDIGASVLLSSGTGTGQLSLSSGLVTLAGVTHTGAVIPTVTTLTGHTAQTGDTYALANGATGFAAIDTVVDAIKVKTDFLPSATAGAAGGVFIAGTNAATTITTGLTTTFTGDLTGSVASVTGAVGSVTGAVGSVTSGVTVTTNNDKAGYALTATTGLGNQTANITGNLSGSVGSVTGAVGSVTGNVGGNINGKVTGNVDGSIGSLAAQAKLDVNAEVDTALADYDAPTNTEMTAAFTEIKGATWSSVTDTLEAIRDATGGGDATLANQTTIITHLTDIKGTGFVTDTHSLTNIEGYADLIDDGTSGLAKIATDVAAILVDTADMQPKLGTPVTSVSADVAAVKVDTAATLVDTNELQTDWADGGRLDLILDARSSQASVDTVDGIVDNIIVDTAEIGAAGAGLTAITGVLPAALIGGRMDSTVSAINNDTAAANRLALSAAQIIPGTVDTVTNGHTPTTTEFQADDITEATADHYNGRVIIFTSGALIGQATAITDYEAVGGIGQFTVVAATEAPANNDTFIII